MLYSALASWEINVPQVTICWFGDINIDGVVLALLVLWLIRMKL